MDMGTLKALAAVRKEQADHSSRSQCRVTHPGAPALRSVPRPGQARVTAPHTCRLPEAAPRRGLARPPCPEGSGSAGCLAAHSAAATAAPGRGSPATAAASRGPWRARQGPAPESALPQAERSCPRRANLPEALAKASCLSLARPGGTTGTRWKREARLALRAE